MSRIITPAQLRLMSLHELHVLCHALTSETAHGAAERARIEIARLSEDAQSGELRLAPRRSVRFSIGGSVRFSTGVDIAHPRRPPPAVRAGFGTRRRTHAGCVPAFEQ